MKSTKHTPFALAVRKSIACLLVLCVVNGPVWALSGANPIAGAEAPNAIAGGTNVEITSNRAIIEWDNFNTATGEVLTFSQSADGSVGLTSGMAVLNRVLDTNMTQFNGLLQGGQGHIIVINPNGIQFGPTAEITAGRFTASTLLLDMTDADFLAGAQNLPFKSSEVKGKIELLANAGDQASINAKRIELLAHEIVNAGMLSSDEGYILLATGDDIYLASDTSDITVQIAPSDSSDTKHHPNYDIVLENGAKIENAGGDLVLAAGDTFSHAIGGTSHLAASVKHAMVIARSGCEIEAKNIEMTGEAINSAEAVAADGGTLNMYAQNDIDVTSLSSSGDMHVHANDNMIQISGTADSGGDMTLDAGSVIVLHDTITAAGEMKVAADTTYSMGSFLAEDDVLLDTDLVLQRYGFIESEPGLYVWDGDQSITSNTGMVTINGFVDKQTFGELNISGGSFDIAVQLNGLFARTPGNLYISGPGHIVMTEGIELSGMADSIIPSYMLYYLLHGEVMAQMPAEWGGVSIRSFMGGIFSHGSDALTADIRGYSDDIYGSAGVDLPYDAGKAAIFIECMNTFKLSAASSLYARGMYLPQTEDSKMGVDDRPGITFLQEDGAVIGGHERNEGIPSDIAIYVGSKAGNVEIGTTDVVVDYDYPMAAAAVKMDQDISIYRREYAYGPATVVFDAYDTVKMPSAEAMIDNHSKEGSGFWGFRLEVASRRTEWLHQAIDNGTLPYADSPEVMEAVLGNDYVLRGAGMDNPEITDGRAWVLEDLPVENVPAPIRPLELPELVGCPAELDAAAIELGVNSDELQLMIAHSMATNPNIQACKACQKLLSAANTLKDMDGSHLAAMAGIFNTLAPADAPFTPEMSASIATALADMAAKDSQYALAGNYIDAFVDYVAVLDNDLKLPVGDAVALVMEKYGNMGNISNPNITAYIMAQMEKVNSSL